MQDQTELRRMRALRLHDDLSYVPAPQERSRIRAEQH